MVQPGAFNIIPNRAIVTAECRHFRTALMNEMEMAILSIARECAASYGLDVSINTTAHMPAAAMSVSITHAILQACEQLHHSHMHLISYAGHDAQILGQVTPAGLIFIPSVGGVGHDPGEYTRWEHVVNGANVLLHTILNLAASA
ncbi:MAG: M20/M25/M40 family metallo-hydrolase [Blastochloris sp.]|nr:M20/M25/M40 family metallo-hydrolase [Blastochloris sp.]